MMDRVAGFKDIVSVQGEIFVALRELMNRSIGVLEYWSNGVLVKKKHKIF